MGKTSLLLRTSVLVLIVLIAAAVNTWLLLSQSVRLDESQSIWVVTKSLSGMYQTLAQDVHVPLYFTILHFWVAILGTNIVVVRLLSVLLYLLTIPVLYRLARDASSFQVALLTVFLYALSPFVLWFAFEGRMYTLLLLVTCFSHLYFLRMIKAEFASWKFAYCISTLLGMLTHYFFFFLIASQSIYMLAVSIHRARENRGKAIKQFISYCGIVFTAVLLFSPWIWYFVYSGSGSQTSPNLATPSSYNVFLTFINFLFGFQSSSVQSLAVALWPLAVIVVFFVFTRKRSVEVRHMYYFALLSILPVVVAFLVSFYRPVFLSRYLIFVTPTLYFLVAWMIMNTARHMLSFVTIGIIILYAGVTSLQSASSETTVREDYELVTDYIEKNATPRDLVAVSAPFTIYPIEYSYNGSARLVTIPRWDRYQEGGTMESFSQESLAKQLQEYEGLYERVFVVLSYDQGYEEDLRNYLESNYKRLDEKQFSPGIQLRVYQFRYDE